MNESSSLKPSNVKTATCIGHPPRRLIGRRIRADMQPTLARCKHRINGNIALGAIGAFWKLITKRRAA
jgi:hypothetical protein